ncbi:MAG: RNA 2',3'-cyclic phosphodiesterase, partial [Bacteroidota bacterium]|nr:RNA 2',3'-cyclic phosphodiesterase [Bacteroidota bacterium]
KIQIIAQELRKACIQFPEFNVCGKSLNVFRSVYKPRVFFVGIEKSDKLIKLKEKVEKILSEFGYIPETREFRPHITIGRTKRIKDINNLKQVIKKYRNEFVIDINVKSIIFYESKLTDNGAVYNVLSEINF